MRFIPYLRLITKVKSKGLMKEPLQTSVETTVCNFIEGLPETLKGQGALAPLRSSMDKLVSEFWTPKMTEAMVNRWQRGSVLHLQTGDATQRVCGMLIRVLSQQGKWEGQPRVRFEKHLIETFQKGKDDRMMREYIAELSGNSRSSLLEKALMDYPELAAFYAVHVVGGRWPEAEPIILADAHASSFYRLLLQIS